MRTAVLYHPRTRPTGRKLATALGVPGATRPHNVIGQNMAILRWGSQRALPYASTGITELNGIRSLALSSDKLRSLHILSNSGHIEEPLGLIPFGTSPESVLEQAARSFSWVGEPIILGRNRHGSKGTDIRVYVPLSVLSILREKYTSLNQRIQSYTSHDLPRGHELYTLYVPNTREYRVHVFRDRVLRVQGKYLDHPDQHTIPYIKNYTQGYRFRAPNRELHSDRLELAKRAVSALGLDFGAVDLIVGEDGKPYFLEVNTAPACSPLTLRAYAEAFAGELDLSVDYAYLERLCASDPSI